MKLIFEKSVPGRRCTILPPCDVETATLPESLRRETKPDLPQLSETDISRHYTELCHQVHGVNCGFYPLGSCTMKYNPRIDEEMAALPGFTNCHPLAPRESLAGMRHVLDTAREYLCEITGMDGMTFQPAAGAHGEFTGVLLIKQYHDARGDKKRTKIIVPDSAHGTNPATAAMCGYEVVNIASGPGGPAAHLPALLPGGRRSGPGRQRPGPAHGAAGGPAPRRLRHRGQPDRGGEHLHRPSAAGRIKQNAGPHRGPAFVRIQMLSFTFRANSAAKRAFSGSMNTVS